MEVAGEDLLKKSFEPIVFADNLLLEGLPNRDSISYGDIYGLGSIEKVRTLLRGTLR